MDDQVMRSKKAMRARHYEW